MNRGQGRDEVPSSPRESRAIVPIALAYCCVVLASFRFVVSEVAPHDGYRWREDAAGMLPVHLILAIFPLAFVKQRFDRPSDVASLFIYFVWYVPFQLLYPHFANDTGLDVLAIHLLHLAAFLFFEWVRRGPLLTLPAWNVSTSNVLVLFAFLTIVGILVLATKTSLAFDFDFARVYEQRMRSRDQLSPDGFSSYTFAFLQYGFGPVVLVMAWARRAWRIAAIGMAGMIVAFAAAGTKGSLLLIPLLLLGVVLGRRLVARRPGLSLLPLLLTLMVAVSIAAYFAFNDTWLSTLFSERLLAGRVLLSAKAFEYFAESPYFYFSDVKGIGPIIAAFMGPDAAVESKGFVLGRFLMGEHSEMNASLVCWTNMYGDIGAIGLLVASLCAAMLMRVVDSIATVGDRIACTAICLMYAFLLCEASFASMVLSGGLIVSVPALWMTTQRTCSISTTPRRSIVPPVFSASHTSGRL